MNKKKNEFYQELQLHGINLSELQIKQFEVYAQVLNEWNQKMNLTAVDNIDDIYERHFLDSVLMSYPLALEGCFCDVGSGAGFPSIPLKIIYPKLEVCIVEPLNKRCNFLRHLCMELNIEVEIRAERAEDFAKTRRESFDYVAARAVANLSMLSELCIPLVKVGGLFVAMKGSKGLEELQEASHATSVLGCEKPSIQKETVNDRLCINLYYKKQKHTPLKYPRAFALLKKHPL